MIVIRFLPDSCFDEALAELNLDAKDLPSFVFSYYKTGRTHALAQVLQELWRALFQVEIELVSMEWKLFLQRIHTGDFEMGCVSYGGNYMDPNSFLELFKTKEGALNDVNWENFQYRNLLEQAAHEVDSGRRITLLDEAERILIDEMPISPLFHENGSYCRRSGLENVRVNPVAGLDCRWVTLAGIEE